MYLWSKNDNVENNHKGPGAARNSGIRHASQKWIAFIDSDDIWYPNKLNRVKEIIESNSDTNFVFHNEMHKKLNGEQSILNDFGSNYQENKPLILQVWRSCIFHTSSIVCHQNLISKSGLFNEDYMTA